MRRLAVIGAGIAGLAAGYELGRLSSEQGEALDLTVFEAGPEPGGKIRSAAFSGTTVELGAESLLARSPVILPLVEDLGLGTELVRPATTAASLWTGRRLQPLPRSAVLGIPLHPWRPSALRVTGLRAGLRGGLEPWRRYPALEPDSSLASFLGPRLGRRLLGRTVEPLLGAVYAGPAGALDVGAVAPQLASAVAGGTSLLRGLRRSQVSAAGGGATPFVSFRGGLSQLVTALQRKLPAGALHLSRRVASLSAGPGSLLRLHADREDPGFDGVVLAIPGAEAAGTVGELAPELASLLHQLDYASVGTATLAYRDGALSQELLGSGFLVAGSTRQTLTAATFLDRKWPHLRQPGLTILRASFGRLGEESSLVLDDASLVTSLHLELRRILRLSQLPVEVRVQRWHGALPQYVAGTLAWRRAVDQAALRVPVPLVVTGSAVAGVGVAACLEGGVAAARQLWERTGPGAAEVGPTRAG